MIVRIVDRQSETRRFDGQLNLEIVVHAIFQGVRIHDRRHRCLKLLHRPPDFASIRRVCGNANFKNCMAPPILR